MHLLLGIAAAAPNGAELNRRAEALNVLGSVLYVAAHPDDENTRLLAYLVGERGYDATYLSLTRGGGGQNLVGEQIAELLGVVRTGELLAARSIDGAEQRFTRARDFGYSKSAQESLSSWTHDAVLNDVVRVIREVQPDVIVTRFGPKGQGHGHHVASAMLAAEAAEKAADPGFVTAGQQPWAVDRILRNESHWRINDDTDTSGWSSIDVGTYDPARGVSWGEVAAASRTMHKSQGFGSAPSVGPVLEYFSAVSGNVPPRDQDPFGGLDTGWSRIEGSKPVQKALAKLAFDPTEPAAALPALAKVHAAVQALPVGHWRARKLADIEQLMRDSAGLWITARSAVPEASPGSEVEVKLRAVFRAARGEVRSVTIFDQSVTGEAVAANTPWESTLAVPLPAEQPWTLPHWLQAPPSETLYSIEEGPARTAPDTAPSVQAQIEAVIAGIPLRFAIPVQYAWTDRVHGELRHDLEILPAVTASFDQRTHMVPKGDVFTLPLTLRGDGEPTRGVLSFTAPDGGTVEPATLDFELGPDQREQIVHVTITPGNSRGQVVAQVDIDGRKSSFARDVIDLAHLPRRTVLRASSLEVVPVDLNRGNVKRIGYVQGSGDGVEQTLRDLGYEVQSLDESALTSGGFKGIDTLVLGIRAFNTRPALRELKHSLLEWVEAGGRLVVQYNTSSSRRPLDDLGPAPLNIRRGRVTDQTAAMTPIDPAADVLNRPNVLGEADYAGWVQERGLYFAQTWDPLYTPVYRINDPGEEPLEGSVLLAAHGKGTFVYTGISFFRQFPAGVPGAARLLANLLDAEAPRGR